MQFFAGGEQALAAARHRLTQPNAEWMPIEEVQLLSPILKPGKILCVGLNYRDHAIESKMEIPKGPTIF